MKKYTSRIILIHWLTLALLVVAWLLGDEVNEARHEGAATLSAYLYHILAGGLVLVLTLARVLFRAKDGVPPPLGDTPMDKVAKAIHGLLYGVLILLPVSGMLQTIQSGIGRAITSGDATLLPAKFTGIEAHEVHEVLVTVLIVLVVVHVLGALKHQFVLKDNLLDRMSLRNKE